MVIFNVGNPFVKMIIVKNMEGRVRWKENGYYFDIYLFPFECLVFAVDFDILSYKEIWIFMQIIQQFSKKQLPTILKMDFNGQLIVLVKQGKCQKDLI